MSDMTLALFIQRVKEHVRDAGVEDTVSKLKAPPGRKPRRRHVEQSEWFNQLSQDNQRNVESVLREAVDEALFGLFAVFDGVRPIDEDFEEEGQFELVYINNGKKVLLNDPDNSMGLHDEYNAITNEDD